MPFLAAPDPSASSNTGWVVVISLAVLVAVVGTLVFLATRYFDR